MTEKNKKRGARTRNIKVLVCASTLALKNQIVSPLRDMNRNDVFISYEQHENNGVAALSSNAVHYDICFVEWSESINCFALIEAVEKKKTNKKTQVIVVSSYNSQNRVQGVVRKSVVKGFLLIPLGENKVVEYFKKLRYNEKYCAIGAE